MRKREEAETVTVEKRPCTQEQKEVLIRNLLKVLERVRLGRKPYAEGGESDVQED